MFQTQSLHLKLCLFTLTIKFLSVPGWELGLIIVELVLRCFKISDIMIQKTITMLSCSEACNLMLQVMTPEPLITV